MTQFNIQGPYSPSCKINFAETNSRTAVFFQVFALPAVATVSSIKAVGGGSACCCQSFLYHRGPYGRERTSGKLVIVSTSIKPSKYHRSIGGTPEATSAIIHQRIFVTCKRHFSSVSGGSIPTPASSLSLSLSLSLSVSFSLALVQPHMSPNMLANSAH